MLYAATALVVVAALVFALLGTWFPGEPADPDGVCGGPGATGCTRAQDWPFIAVVLGGPLAAVLLLCAVTAHVLRAVSGWFATRGGR
ncbi:hypothetical protein [Patulibacter minatonensis]|uniref:hypothetical protein n=1 Tax=Patulibacter minatonensis TaxID=298163 RepID=UPI0004B59C85|nr:hypothetical protein [Patulibacter minatonensis]